MNKLRFKKFGFEDFTIEEIKSMCEGGNSIPLEKDKNGVHERADAIGILKKASAKQEK